MADEIIALLGKGTHFEGVLSFPAPVRIDGSFKGVIRSDSVLVIGDGAEVDARIAVGTVIVKGGSLKGQVVAREAIEAYAPARIDADLHSPSLFLDKGVAFQGRCRMDPVTEGDIATVLAEPVEGA